MATTARGSSAGKEKRGTSPSGSLIKKTPKPANSNPGSSSSSPTKEATSSPTDSKPVPNYLKPTISSNLDFSRLPKKSTTDAAAQKPALNRRRSFDRPPSASQVQKAIRNVPGVKEVKPLRSSSFNYKATSSSPSASSNRPVSERSHVRSASGVKDSKPEPNMTKSRSLKKSSLSSAAPTGKKDVNGAPSSSSTKKAPKSVTSESSLDYDNPSVDQLAAEDDLVNIDNEVQSLPEISEMPDSSKELGDPTVTDVEVAPVKDVQENTVSDEHPNDQEDKSVDVDQVPAESETQESVTVDQKQEEKEEQIVETETKLEPETKPEPENKPEPETKPEPEPAVEAEEQNVTEVVAENKDETVKEEPAVEPIDEPSETLVAETKKEEADLEQEAEKGTEEAVAEDKSQSDSNPATPTPTPTPSATDAAAPAKPQPAAGKKDKQAYNDVIEETTAKLMGGRKNKVLAMAGAFETVISLQDTNKK